MTDVNCFTSEHTTTTTTTTTTAAAAVATTPTTPVKNEPACTPTSPFVLRAPPSAKSKLILQNMEEVLNTVKKQHREKHKRKREEKRRAAMLAEAEAEVQASHVTAGEKPQPLREKTVRENGRKPTAKEEEKSMTPVSKAKNVFELMMNARKSSLGTNAQGQHSPEQQQPELSATPLSQRKQLLQEWNERKGGTKRRLADDARGEYIETQLDQRAKRLKKMLTQPELVKEEQQQQQQQQLSNSAPAKRGRGRPRTRRPSADAEQVELASPTKKRDSLLGYFAKVESPKIVETPKRRGRNSKALQATPVQETPAETATPTGRPRRSCTGKARYDYDLERSPTKAKQPEPPPPSADDSIEIIELDNSNSALTPKKLAPLFMKQLPKPSPDPSVLLARQAFLQSGVPEKLKQEASRQKSFEQYYEEHYELFPKIAHVASGTPATELKLKLKELNCTLPATARKPSLGSITNCTQADFAAAATKRMPHSVPALPQLENKRALVKHWKTDFDRFPTFKCYNQMREKYRHFSAIDAAQESQPMGESFVVTRRTRRSLETQQLSASEPDAKPPAMAPNGELLFTEKYKPLMFDQVLVNLTPVQQLRDFLASWRGELPNSEDSQLDFSLDSSSLGASCNTMVLLGPCSSGKTNAVFALANDMNFNVLEINAGMKRKGKKLLQELQEATQSHQIRKEAKAGAAAPTQQLLQKLNGQKGKKQEEEVRKSLILIEDADIVFENMDAGFTDAIYALAASSKRPVIIVASDANCAHLQRLMQQNIVYFHAPNALNISRFLAVLSLMENCPLALNDLISLYLFNKQNLRKTLMELQFFVQSGGDAAVSSASKSPVKSLEGIYIHQRLFDFYTQAQNVQHCIPYPVDFALLRLNLSEILRSSARLQPSQASVPSKQAKRKSRSPKKTWLNKSEEQQTPLASLASFYEQLSTATQLTVCLAQEAPDRLRPQLAEQLAHSLVECAIKTELGAQQYAYTLFDKPLERHNLSEQLVSCSLRSSSARALDYEPALRAICRSEQQRAGLERRSTRFYHYLRNHATGNSFSTEHFDVACNVLQESNCQHAAT
ncbi:CG16838 [Drosophila busckii]|uniref:CG16838 n=1 Tax=Drosophila busckii TaxID=30019 RepID=A0A0M4EIZ7_DROBS|nr:ATPase family AAA domain-containing protein 5 [Drosophila busckii]ALC43926.1 CG16838 [Drosophila busckii]